MPYVARSTANRRGSYRYTKRRGRRRTSVIAQAKQRKSAHAQSRQIQRVARVALRNRSLLKAQRVYTDYVLRGTNDDQWIAGSWQVFPLMDITLWKTTMRENTAAQYTQTAYIPSIYLQYVAALNDLTKSAAMSMYLVTIRNAASNFVPKPANLVNGEQWQSLSPLCAPVLNTGIFNIKWQKTFMLLNNSLTASSATDAQIAGDPSSSYVRGAMTLKVKANLRTPSVFAPPAIIPDYWQVLEDINLPPHQRVYLLAYYSSEDVVNQPGMFWSTKMTAVTSN